jgi:hypothetical protein
MSPITNHWFGFLKTGLCAVLAAFLLAGCAGVQEGWTSYPRAREVKNAYFEAQIKPARRDPGEGPFQGFFLYIKNLSRDPLEIAWDRTYYIQGRENKGGFIVGDGDAAAHPYFPTPPRSILPGRVLQEYLWPDHLAAAADNAGERALQPLKPGTHGVYLTIVYPGLEAAPILPPQPDEDRYPWNQALAPRKPYLASEYIESDLAVFLPLSIVLE